MSIPSSSNGDMYNAVLAPGDVMHPALDVHNATYVDVNPLFDPNTAPAHLLLDIYAVLYGSIANLIVCPPGARGRIFQEDYFCGLVNLLQEPFDGQTSSFISMDLTTAIKNWEPRLANVTVSVEPVSNPAGYMIAVAGSIVGIPDSNFQASYNVPVTQG